MTCAVPGLIFLPLMCVVPFFLLVTCAVVVESEEDDFFIYVIEHSYK